MLKKLSAEKQAYLTRLLEVQRTSVGEASSAAKPSQSKGPSGPQFRFHKHLATSRYEEFLAESDDEDFFKSKPVTKDGRSYELDFKIDAYRDEIKLNKNGSKKKLMPANLAATNGPLNAAD